ncbi:hypothetical protein RB601_007111 [Gaeumannomyces tritici]
MSTSKQGVQCFGKKRTATAVAQCVKGQGLIKVNGRPLSLVEPATLRYKVYEPLLVIGLDQVSGVDIRVRVTGGGHTSQVYAVRQAIAKSIVAYYQKYVDEHSKNLLKQALTQYDRTLLVADNRRCEYVQPLFLTLTKPRRKEKATTEETDRLPTIGPRSSVVPAPAPGSRSRTVNLCILGLFVVLFLRLAEGGGHLCRTVPPMDGLCLVAARACLRGGGAARRHRRPAHTAGRTDGSALVSFRCGVNGKRRVKETLA